MRNLHMNSKVRKCLTIVGFILSVYYVQIIKMLSVRNKFRRTKINTKPILKQKKKTTTINIVTKIPIKKIAHNLEAYWTDLCDKNFS